MLRYALFFLLCAPLLAQTYTDHLSFGSIGIDTAYGVACDNAGNTYGVYHFDGTVDVQPGAGTHDITGFFAAGIVKYDSARAVTWARVIEPVNPGDRVIPEMPAVDTAGNVYVVGRFFGQVDFDPGAGTAIESAIDTFNTPTTQFNAFLLKLDATGAFQWVRVLPGDHTWGVRVTCTDTHVAITGLHIGTNDLDPTNGTQIVTSTGLASFTAMFDAAGTRIWAHGNATSLVELSSPPIIGAGNEVTVISSYGVDLTLTHGGTTYTPVGNVDMVMTQYTATGAISWVKFVGAVGANVVPCWAAPDHAGGYYVVGNWRTAVDFDPGTGSTIMTPQQGLNAFVCRYTGSGDLVWGAPFHCSGDTNMFTCASDANGVVVGGSFVGQMDTNPASATNLLDHNNGSAFAVRLDANGFHVWSVNFGGTTALATVECAVYGMASDGAGNVVLGGPYDGSADWDPGAGTQISTSSAARDGWVLWLDDGSAATPPQPVPLQIATATIATVSEGAPVNAALTATGGSGSGYQWTLLTGQLPPGVSGIPGTGTPWISLTGSPTTAGNYSFTVQVTDDAANTDVHGYIWMINPPGATYPTPPPGGGGDGGGCAAHTRTTAYSWALFGLLTLAVLVRRNSRQREHP